MCATPSIFAAPRSQIPDSTPHQSRSVAVSELQQLVDHLNVESRAIRQQSQAQPSHSLAMSLLTESIVLEHCAHRLERLIHRY